jgi:tRNA pseudouridine38-40 synthase
MRNLAIQIAYDGADFHGWQIQPGQTTIQGLLQSVLSRLEGTTVTIQGSGRTDAGVHALSQVASFKLANPIPIANISKAINDLLPESIRVMAAQEVSAEFHARHSATAKTYEYRIHRGRTCSPFKSRYAYALACPLDETSMTATTRHFVGTHDFRALTAAGGEENQSTVRTIYSSEIHRNGDLLTYRVRGNGFLYHMVRNIVGTLIKVGRGNLTPDDMPKLLAGKDRATAGPTAPPQGLFLVNVEYENLHIQTVYS